MPQVLLRLLRQCWIRQLFDWQHDHSNAMAPEPGGPIGCEASHNCANPNRLVAAGPSGWRSLVEALQATFRGW